MINVVYNRYMNKCTSIFFYFLKPITLPFPAPSTINFSISLDNLVIFYICAYIKYKKNSHLRLSTLKHFVSPSFNLLTSNAEEEMKVLQLWQPISRSLLWYSEKIFKK